MELKLKLTSKRMSFFTHGRLDQKVEVKRIPGTGKFVIYNKQYRAKARVSARECAG